VKKLTRRQLYLLGCGKARVDAAAQLLQDAVLNLREALGSDSDPRVTIVYNALGEVMVVVNHLKDAAEEQL
jgi:hypothetical protein